MYLYLSLVPILYYRWRAELIEVMKVLTYSKNSNEEEPKSEESVSSGVEMKNPK